MATLKTLLTAADLLRISSSGKRCGLVKGVLTEMTPSGARHGRVAMRIGRILAEYVGRQSLGEVFAAETGFRIYRDPDTVRAPDAAFVSAERPPEELPERYLDLAPDLAVEVISPSDSATEVQAKVESWLRAGVRLVWVVYPSTKSVVVYTGLDHGRVLTEEDDLSGQPALPGFACPVKELF